MLEFIFFHQNISRQFTDFVASTGIDCNIDDDGDSITVAIPEDIDDDIADRIEEEYDRLLDLSREQIDREELDNQDDYQKASLLITLDSGDKTCAHVDADTLNRILRVISNEALNELIGDIVDAVEHPDDRSYCQRLKDSRP
jgi:hypothetical protein